MSHASTYAMELETTTGLPSRKVAIWTFIGSECMFFASLISTYMVYKGKSLAGPYPHTPYTAAGGEVFKPILNIPLTSVSTFVLLMSSLGVVLALAAAQRGSRKGVITWLIVTIILGSMFVGGQVYEFNSFVHEGLTLKQNLFGASFFVLTGFHGAHVTIGLIWLTTILITAIRGKLPPDRAVNLDIAALYWHFVDVVWIVIFTLVYLIP
ncbi:MAG TPA: cytochrome c oxidase subunit 3 [Gemmatimonadales bacterium]|nr:cytochrome c oxidase subunit 3 [Gemmatimonadales bacterium]